MNQYGLPLQQPSVQTLLPAMNQSGLMYGFYIISTTTFTGNETTFPLVDMVVPIMSVTVDANPTEPGRPMQYMAAVFPISTPIDSMPWASSALIPASDYVSRVWIMAGQGWGARETKGTLLSAISTSMAPNLGPALGTSPMPATPNPNAPMTWAATVSTAIFASGNSFFDIGWKTLFDKQSPIEGGVLTIVSSPPSGFRAAVIGTPVDRPVDAIAQLGQMIIYENVRFINTGAVPGVYIFVFRVSCMDGSLTTVTLTITLTP